MKNVEKNWKNKIGKEKQHVMCVVIDDPSLART